MSLIYGIRRLLYISGVAFVLTATHDKRNVGRIMFSDVGHLNSSP